MQAPPGEQVAPATTWQASGGEVQSAAVQQLATGMQELLAAQTFWPAGQPHEPPAPEQVSPVTVQSPVVQQAPLGMQLLLALQTF